MSLYSKIRKEVNAFLEGTFVAPYLGGRVATLISNLVCTLDISDPPEYGWYVFEPQNIVLASVVRAASIGEIEEYMLGLPYQQRLVLFRSLGNGFWLAVGNDLKVSKISLVTGASRFDCVFGRAVVYSSDSYLYYGDASTGPVADEIRLRFVSGGSAEDVQGVSPAECVAYDLAKQTERALEKKRHRRDLEGRLLNAAEHSSAQIIEYVESEDNVTVRYRVLLENGSYGSVHRSVFDKRNLNAVTAGFCMAGTDRLHDFQTVINVVRHDL
ncbi:MAG: hypothetical protein GY861_21390 [bacterium]|nr:hypothetical protein [bacterium]